MNVEVRNLFEGRCITVRNAECSITAFIVDSLSCSHVSMDFRTKFADAVFFSVRGVESVYEFAKDLVERFNCSIRSMFRQRKSFKKLFVRVPVMRAKCKEQRIKPEVISYAGGLRL